MSKNSNVWVNHPADFIALKNVQVYAATSDGKMCIIITFMNSKCQWDTT